MKIKIQIECESEAEAHSVTERLLGIPGRAVRVIDPKDNPEYGSDVAVVNTPTGPLAVPLPPSAPAFVAPQPSTSLLSDVGFGQGVTLPAGAIPIHAPASAVAGLPATVPAAPSGIPTAPPAPTALAPQPAAAAAVPAAPAAPPAPVPGVALDKAGMPWDGRIHSSTKAQIKDGTWRQKRDLDPAIKVQVEAELRAALAANAASAPVALPAAALPPSPPAQATPAASGASPSEPAAPAATWDFGSLAAVLTPLMMSNAITQDQVSTALKKHGLAAYGQLALAPNVIPLVAADLGLQHPAAA